MGLADDLKDLDRRIAVTFERTLADFRQRLASRLKEEGEATLRALDEIAPSLPEQMLADDDFASVARQASTSGARAAIDDLSRAARRLDRGSDQVEVLSALLEEAARHASRAALVLCSTEGLRGWAAAGFGGGLRSIEDFATSDPPNEAWKALFAGDGVARLSAADCAPLCNALDAPLPAEGVLIPFVLSDSIAAGLYADREDGAPLDVASLQLLTHLAALGVELQGLRRRSRTPTLYEAGEADGAGLAVWSAPPPDSAASVPVAVGPGGAEPAVGGAPSAPTVTPEAPAPSARDAIVAPQGHEPWEDVETAAEPVLEQQPEIEDAPELPAPALEVSPSSDTAIDEIAAASTWEAVETTEEPVAAVWQAAADQPAFAEVDTAETSGLADLDAATPELPELASDPASEASWESIEDMPTSDIALDRGDSALATQMLETPVSPATPAEPAQPMAAEAGNVSFDATVAVSRDILQRYAQMPSDEASAVPSAASTAPTPLPTLSPDPDLSEDETVLLARSRLAPPPAAPTADSADDAADAGKGDLNPQVLPPTDLQGPGWAFTGGRPAAAHDDPAYEEARRLARLLVSEIKLYNEEHVEEGRRNHDIYDRLREDIDRSRQMYEERVDPKVRDHDFFQEALVRVLAGGDAKALGA